MIRMTVEQGSAAEIERALGNLRDKSALVMARAANRTAGNVRKTIKEESGKRYIIKAGDIQKGFHMVRANQSNPVAHLFIRGTHLNLSKFKIKAKRKDKKIAFYLANVKKDSSPGALSAKPRPFLASMSNGFSGMFVRKTDEPGSAIRGVAGPSVPQMIGNDDIMNRVRTEAEKEMQKRIKHEIDYLLSK